MSAPLDVVVAGWVGSTNLGDELVHAGVHRLLDDTGLGERVTVVSQDPAATHATFGGGAVSPAGAARAIARADLLVWGGGGIVQDETSALNLPYHLSRPALAAAARVPWVGIGLGAGPLVGRAADAQLRVLHSAVGLGVRDPASAALLAEHGVPGALVGADAALALDVPDVEVQDVLVASLRPWEQQVTGAARLLPVALRSRLRSGGGVDADAERIGHHARVLDTASAATGLPVRLVALQTDADAALLDAVAVRMKADVEVVVPDVHTLVDTVAAGRVVVAMRYHAGIAATLGGRPLVALSYSPKVTALAGALGTGARRLAWDAEPSTVAHAAAALLADDDADDVVATARGALRGRLQVHRELLARAAEAARRRRDG